MAHGLESRVPFVDTDVVEFAATLPADVKFKNGQLKHALNRALRDALPDAIAERRDKMGFPVPLGEWMKGELRDFIVDSLAGSSRPYLTGDFNVEEVLGREGAFSRNLWGLLSLELWQQAFHDQQAGWHAFATSVGEAPRAPAAL